MRHYDPWIFEMTLETELRERLRCLDDARLAQQAFEWQAATSSGRCWRVARGTVRRLINGLLSARWPRRRPWFRRGGFPTTDRHD
jgi:hypothetical protein